MSRYTVAVQVQFAIINLVSRGLLYVGSRTIVPTPGNGQTYVIQIDCTQP